MEIYVCVGSSCHLKGSYKIVEAMKTALKEHGMDEEVQLKASFCMGHCAANGVTVRIGDEIVRDVTEENFADVFDKYVLMKQ